MKLVGCYPLEHQSIVKGHCCLSYIHVNVFLGSSSAYIAGAREDQPFIIYYQRHKVLFTSHHTPHRDIHTQSQPLIAIGHYITVFVKCHLIPSFNFIVLVQDFLFFALSQGWLSIILSGRLLSAPPASVVSCSTTTHTPTQPIQRKNWQINCFI